jgi:hypothetical protein
MQHTNLSIVAVFFLLGLITTASWAQTRPLPRSSAMSGTLRDSGTGQAPLKARVCAFIPTGPSAFQARCAAIDTLGNYNLDSLPPRAMRVSVSCETIRGMGKALAYDSVVFTDSVLLRRDWVVSPAGCDARPLRRVTGTFRGHYTPGFESSEFVPCAADAWFVPGDSLGTYPYDGRRAWATWPKGVGQGIKWPDAPRDSYGNPRYYVRWRGTIVGPGRYGHMGVSPFEFVVDTVFELRPPRKRDCR